MGDGHSAPGEDRILTRSRNRQGVRSHYSIVGRATLYDTRGERPVSGARARHRSARRIELPSDSSSRFVGAKADNPRVDKAIIILRAIAPSEPRSCDVTAGIHRALLNGYADDLAAVSIL